jgi:hypothetical protein
MNKGILYVGILLVMIASVFATIDNSNSDCKELGTGDDYYEVAKYNCNVNDCNLAGTVLSPYEINVDGNKESADWTSEDYNVQAVVKVTSTTEAQGTYGMKGTVTGLPCNPADLNCDKIYGINQITFCGKEGNGGGGGGSGGSSNVPEFSTITLGLAILGAGLGLVFMRKQH